MKCPICILSLFLILTPLSVDGGYKQRGHKRKSMDPWIVPELAGEFIAGIYGGSITGALCTAGQLHPSLIITGLTVGEAVSSTLSIYGIGNWVGKRKGNFKTTFWSGLITGFTGFAIIYIFFNDRKYSEYWTDVAFGTMFVNFVSIPIGATIGYNLSKEEK